MIPWRLIAYGVGTLALLGTAWGAWAHYKSVKAERDLYESQLSVCQSANETNQTTIDELEREANNLRASLADEAARAADLIAERDAQESKYEQRIQAIRDRRPELSADECAAMPVPDDRIRLLQVAGGENADGGGAGDEDRTGAQ